jgi:[ribosomal protein S5]-alanine N-acetyltransferase
MGILSTLLGTERDSSLAGGKVVLRLPDMDDYDSWQALRRKSRAFLEPWEPKWDERELSRLSFRERVRRCTQLANEDQAYAYLIFNLEDELVGGITLSNVRRGVAQMGSLGYWIGAPFQRQGYMTDAVIAVSQHAMRVMGLNRVEAACLPHNAASVRLLQACQFEQEGRARRYLKINGKWEDHLLFAKVSAE